MERKCKEREREGKKERREGGELFLLSIFLSGNMASVGFYLTLYNKEALFTVNCCFLHCALIVDLGTNVWSCTKPRATKINSSAVTDRLTILCYKYTVHRLMFHFHYNVDWTSPKKNKTQTS